jgi:putative copper resistance protein D
VFDVLGFVAVVLQALDLVAQAVLIGSVAFTFLVVAPLPDLSRQALGIVRAAALATIVTSSMTTLVTSIVLRVSLGIPAGTIVGATFFVAGAIRVAAAMALAVVASSTGKLPHARCGPGGASVAGGGPAQAGAYSSARGFVCFAAAAALLCTAVVDTHAMARIGDAKPLLVATAAHELGAAVWLGALPCFLMTLRRADPEVAAAVGRRFSIMAACGVALIVAGAVVFARFYIGTLDAVYGTAYGAMAATKGVLLAILLALGFANFRTLRSLRDDATKSRRVMRFVEVEMAVGIAVLVAAASITSAPPSVDVVDRVTLAQLLHRMAPQMPRMTSPAPSALAAPRSDADADVARDAEDRAWSEYNHQWAVLAVVVMGVAALALQSGRARFARHWPLLFLVLAGFLLLRADPEVWPLGPIGPIESLRDPEVVQHRLFVVLIAAFALFEWRVRARGGGTRALLRVFPLATTVGGVLLLMHSHAVGDVKEQLLIEMTHLPIAVLGVVAGCARWLEVTAPDEEGRWARWIWPTAFVLVGLLLLDYREA